MKLRKSFFFLTAVLFASSDDAYDNFHVEISEVNDVEQEENTHRDPNVAHLDFAGKMKSAGLEYFAGYITNKFPQFVSQRSNEDENQTFFKKASWRPDSLVTPSNAFVSEIQHIQKLFLCYHGENIIKPGNKINTNFD